MWAPLIVLIEFQTGVVLIEFLYGALDEKRDFSRGQTTVLQQEMVEPVVDVSSQEDLLFTGGRIDDAHRFGAIVAQGLPLLFCEFDHHLSPFPPS
jgi:hypothetical protein